ncbi:MAG: GNAT family N-acetyltransferase [Actinomycetota bacterium]
MDQEPNAVVLRDVTDRDVAVFFEHQLDAVANELAAFPARDHEAHRAHWARILRDDTIITKSILVNGQVAGNIVSWEQKGNREVGYWIGRDHWGKGVATKALSQFIELVLQRPLHAYVAKHNAGSIRVLEKCGFRPCG